MIIGYKRESTVIVAVGLIVAVFFSLYDVLKGPDFLHSLSAPWRLVIICVFSILASLLSYLAFLLCDLYTYRGLTKRGFWGEWRYVLKDVSGQTVLNPVGERRMTIRLIHGACQVDGHTLDSTSTHQQYFHSDWACFDANRHFLVYKYIAVRTGGEQNTAESTGVVMLRWNPDHRRMYGHFKNTDLRGQSGSMEAWKA